jgi:ABC-2 type transport system permease protein
VSWRVIARKEFRDASRSRTLWVLSALLVLFVAGATYAIGIVLSGAPEADATGETLVGLLTQQGSLFITSIVPILGLMASYASVVGERTSGSIKILLGLPHSRRDAVVGKFAGRSAVIVVSLLLAFAAGFVVLLSYEEVSLPAYLVLVLLTCVLGVVYVGVGVGLSAAIASRSRTAAAAVGFFVFFKILWDSFPSIAPRLILYITTGKALEQPDWYDSLLALSPNIAYSNVAAGFLNGFGSVETFSVFVLSVWLVAPVTVGYLRFRGADL